MNKGTKVDRQAFKPTSLPEETKGVCIRKRCNNYTSLGNGYCMQCWDKGWGWRKIEGKGTAQILRRNTW